MLPGKNQKSVFTAKVPVRFKKVLKKLHESFKKSLPPEKINSKLKTEMTVQNQKLLVFEAKKGYGQWQK